MRFFLLWFCMLFLLVSRLWAVSFPEDDEPLNTVDYHCKSPKAISLFTKEAFCLSFSMSIHFQHQRQILICLYHVLHIKSSAVFSSAVQKLSQFCWVPSCSSPDIEIIYFQYKRKRPFADNSPSFTNLYSRP